MFLKLRIRFTKWLVSKIVPFFDSHYVVRNNLLDEPGLEQAFDAFDNRDYYDAFEMFLDAAKVGNATAQYNVGLCYDTNSGVWRDDQAAEEWYRKAAEQGIGKAQYNLCCLLAADIMTSDDKSSQEDQDRKMVDAYMWLTIANEQGCSESADAPKRVAAHMSPEQIEEAEKLAREWIEKRRQ